MQTKMGNRIVVIGRKAPANKKTGYREPNNSQATSQRIVVIRNGELVRSRRGR
jgi:hypothetical protein